MRMTVSRSTEIKFSNYKISNFCNEPNDFQPNVRVSVVLSLRPNDYDGATATSAPHVVCGSARHSLLDRIRHFSQLRK